MKIAAKLATCLLPLLLAASPVLAQAPSGCDTPESHQFDFWVGKWEVFPAAHPDTKIADSLIEKLYAGCAVRENWMPLKGPGGGSLNAWDADTGKWRQTWLDSGGRFADFYGGWDGAAMSIQGVWPQPGKPKQMTRMTYIPHADGSVEQAGFTSDDNGATWQPSFDLIYRHPAA